MSPFRARVEAAVTAWDLSGGVVTVAAGDAVTIPGTDQFFAYQAHPEFRYFTGHEVESGVLGIDLSTAEHELFSPHPDADDRVWHCSDAPPGQPAGELQAWIDARGGSGPIRQLGATEDPAEPLRGVLDELRVHKDAAELDAMRAAAAATTHGFAVLEDAVAAGLSEHQLRSVVDGAFGFAGAERPAYDSIVAGGPNAAVLHHSPGSRCLADGDFLLVDAGARVDGYACDVTRTWAVGSASQRHRVIWDAVSEAQQLAIERCVPGAEYREIHLSTARDLATALVDIGLLAGEPADLVQRGVMAVFIPHGVGHMIGQNVHDTGGYGPGRERTEVGGTRFLRADRPLEPDMVVTIEPGIYFIDALLDDPAVRERFGDDIAWEHVEDFRGIGGVRIEDTVLVTDKEPEVFSAGIPKRLEI